MKVTVIPHYRQRQPPAGYNEYAWDWAITIKVHIGGVLCLDRVFHLYENNQQPVVFRQNDEE